MDGPRQHFHGPKTDRIPCPYARFGSWLSWLGVSALDPVALRRHLSVV